MDRRRCALALVGGLMVLGGCTLFTSLDGLALGGPPDGAAPDVSAAEGGLPPSDAGTEAEAAASLPNLHPFGGFETGCGSWGAYFSALEPNEVAHTGSGSCRVCPDNADPDFTADDNGAVRGPPIGAEYLAEVWVRAAPGRPASNAVLVLRSRNDSPFREPEKVSEALPTPVTDVWQKITARLTVTKAAQSINVVVAGRITQGNECFLLDDVAVYRVK
jgi:hypothetical protein